MNDTPSFVESLFKQKIMEKSNEERIIMGSLMFDAARKMVLASLSDNISPQEKRKSIFLRLYGNDFDEATKQSILHTLSRQKSDKLVKSQKLGDKVKNPDAKRVNL